MLSVKRQIALIRVGRPAIDTQVLTQAKWREIFAGHRQDSIPA
jgi:hypothetical protein